MRVSKLRDSRGRDSRTRVSRLRESAPRGAGSDPLVFDLPLTGSALSQLDQSLTINSIAKQPTYQYLAQDATTAAWAATVGTDLAIAGSGSDVVPDRPTPLLSTVDRGVTIDAGKHFGGGVSYGNPGTNDAVWEFVFRYGTRGTLLGDLGTGAVGVQFSWTSGGIRIRLSDGGTAITRTSAAMTVGGIYHWMVFADRSGSVLDYVNGTAGASTVISGVGDMTTDAGFALGNNQSGGSASFSWDEDVFYAAMWEGASWLDTHVQATVAQQRFWALCGLRADRASASAYPAVATRASTAHVYKYNATLKRVELFRVGAGWLRTGSDADRANKKLIKGYLPEEAATNLLTDSEDFSAWTEVDTGDTQSLDGATAPNHLGSADGNIADATNGQHGFTDTATLTAVGYVFSVYRKADKQGWAYLSDDTVAGADAYFDLVNGNVGSIGGSATAGIQDMGDGWRRCWIGFTGTAAVHTLRSADADANTNIFAGDASSVSTWHWGAQLETDNGSGLPSSYIYTSGATATRVADRLYYDQTPSDHTGKGSIYCEAKIDEGTTTLGRLYAMDNPTAHFIRTYMDTSEKLVLHGNNGAYQWIITSASAYDEAASSVFQSYDTNDVKAFVDGSSIGTDVSAAPPTAFDSIKIGSSTGGASQLNGIISNVQIYNDVVAVGAPTSRLEDLDMASQGNMVHLTDLTAAATASTPIKVGATSGTTQAGYLLNFTHTDPNKLTYTGTATSRFTVSAGASFSSSANATTVELILYKNGVAVTGAELDTIVGINEHASITVPSNVELATGDYLELYLESDKNATVTIDDFSVVVTEII